MYKYTFVGLHMLDVLEITAESEEEASLGLNSFYNLVNSEYIGF